MAGTVEGAHKMWRTRWNKKREPVSLRRLQTMLRDIDIALDYIGPEWSLLQIREILGARADELKSR
jgi:hypothetical protein